MLPPGKMLEMGRKTWNGYKMAKEILESGKAYAKFIEIVNAQEGRELRPEQIAVGRYTFDVHATASGKIIYIDNSLISKTARLAGAPGDKGARPPGPDRRTGCGPQRW